MKLQEKVKNLYEKTRNNFASPAVHKLIYQIKNPVSKAKTPLINKYSKFKSYILLKKNK